MARFAVAAVMALLLAVAAAQDRTPARWCVSSEDELAFCEKNLEVMNAGQDDVTFSCALVDTDMSCTETIAAGDADFMQVGGYDAYEAWSKNGQQALLHFDDPYNAVAVVKKEMCDANPEMTFADLEGKSACSTGYRKTAGWVVPTGFLLGRNIVPYVTTNSSIQTDAQSMASFFGDMCAARISGNGPATTEDGEGAKYDELCGACEGDCTTDDPLYDYQGALRGVMDGKCDVAFTKYSTLVDYTVGGELEAEWSTLSQEDLALVCPSGGCAPVNGSAGCRLAQSPAHAIVAAGDYANPAALRRAFAELVADDDFKAAVLTAEANPEGLLIESGVNTTVDVFSTPVYLGDIKQAFDAFTLIDAQVPADGDLPTARYCVSAQDELDFLNEHLETMNAEQDHVVFEGVLPEEGSDCIKTVAAGDADFMRTGSYDIWNGWSSAGMEAVLWLENEGDGAFEYSAVMVVDKAMCDANPNMTFSDLEGKNLCSTGYRKTAGWVTPTGYMLAFNHMPYVNQAANVQTDAQSVAAFFGDVCAPRTSGNGPRVDADGDAQLWDELCGACDGDCSEDGEPLGDYEGSLRGLMQGNCEVSWNKHSIPADYSKGGAKEQEWSTKRASDLRLVCPQGGCAEIEDYASCRIAPVPGHAVSTAGTYPHKQALRNAFKDLIDADDFKATVLSAEGNPEGFVLEHETVGAQDVYSTLEYLGDIVNAYNGYAMLENIDSGSSALSSAGR